MSFLNKNIINFEPKIFGLDVSDLSIKIFQIEKEGDNDIVRGYGAVDVPVGSIEDGRIVDGEKIAAAIKTVLKLPSAKKINSNKVICSLSESKVFVRIITIPKMNMDEVREAIKWEMEASMPMSLSEVYFDWQILDWNDEKKQRVLTAAVSREVIDSWMDVLSSAGMDVYGLEVESVASARSLIERKSIEAAETCLIVDLGAKKTSFIITEGAVPYFTSSIPFSSEGINDAISKAMNLNRNEAEKIKIENGIEDLNKKNPVFDAVKPLLENLIVEINKTMDFYKEMSKYSNVGINKIILCGGGANMKGLPVYLNERIKIDVVVGDPWINLNMGKNLPIINKEISVRYATVIGLALKGVNYGDQS